LDSFERALNATGLISSPSSPFQTLLTVLVKSRCKNYLKSSEDDGMMYLSCEVNDYTTTETLILLKSVMNEGESSGGVADEELLNPSMAYWNTLNVCSILGVVTLVLKKVNALDLQFHYQVVVSIGF
jgi:hypothetical protein